MVKKYLDLSTRHVKQGFGMISVPFRILDHQYGWIIFVPDELEEETVESLKEQEAEYLIELIEYAKKNECLMINLDSDGEEIEELKSFDW